MKPFVKIVNAEKPLTIFAKSSILDVWQGSEYASGWTRTFSKILEKILKKPKKVYMAHATDMGHSRMEQVKFVEDSL